MKRRINKKGFTIVELLAVVVIIGVIGTIAIVGVNSVIKRSHEKYNLAQAKLFVAAAQTYFSDHKSRLPVRTFTQTTVTLNELIEENYIDQIVDYKKEPYDVYKSYASATKMGAGQYAYDGELITKDGERAKYKENKNSNGSIIFKNEGSTLTSELYTNNEKEIEIVMSDSDTIAGYIVSIYKNNKKVEDLEYKEIGNSTSASTKVKLSKNIYKDGKYKIHVKLIDIYNNQKIAYSKYITLDTIKPECKIITTGTKGDNDWYTSNVKFKLQIKEANNFTYAIGGINRRTGSHNGTDNFITITKTSNSSNEFVQTDTTGVFWNATVTDLAGNNADCKYEDATISKRIKVDTTQLSCEIAVTGELGNNNWYTSNVDLELEYTKNSKSKVSYGISQSTNPEYNEKTSISINNNTSGSNYYGYVKNEAGTKTKCSKSLKIDKTEPSIRIKYDGGVSGYWYKTSKNVTVDDYSVGISGIASIKDSDGTYYSTSNLTKTYTPNPSVVKNVSFTITNGAGKSAKSNEVRVLLDNRNPKLSVRGGEKEDTKNYLYVSCTHDNPSINSILGWNFSATTEYCKKEEHRNNSEWIKLNDGSYKFKGAVGCIYTIDGKCGNFDLQYTAVDVSKKYYCYTSAEDGIKNCLTKDHCKNNIKTCCDLFASHEGWNCS